MSVLGILSDAEASADSQLNLASRVLIPQNGTCAGESACCAGVRWGIGAGLEWEANPEHVVWGSKGTCHSENAPWPFQWTLQSLIPRVTSAVSRSWTCLHRKAKQTKWKTWLKIWKKAYVRSKHTEHDSNGKQVLIIYYQTENNNNHVIWQWHNF